MKMQEMKRGWRLAVGAILILLTAIVASPYADGASRNAPRALALTAEAADGTIQWFPIIAYTPVTVDPGGKPEYGVAFMSSAEAPADNQQYQNALATGASWNRWPIYWPGVEQSAGSFSWGPQDATVIADLAHGIRINAILLGTPYFYQTGLETEAEGGALPVRPTGRVALFKPETAAPQGLFEPVFSDGSDVPGSGKTINANNKWARFVFKAVERYRPGGVLAQQLGWPAGVGVTHWEMWNEPELAIFWDGTVAEYARLLKVGYLATRQADPGAKVLFGGLANFYHETFLDEVLDIYDADPLAASFNYFHDILATHNYFESWRSWHYVYRNVNTLAEHGLERPIWLNESGVPAWNDYPGPVWDSRSGYRATKSEQADFVIQNALYATFAGADVIFHFQLYDGCGNQPAGTDFPPHNGELCDANGNLVTDPRFPCAGDANGLFSNPTDATCFTHHPQPESPRPNFAAFRVLTSYFRDVVPLWRLRPGGTDPYNGPQEWIAFFQPKSGQRIVGLWSRFGTSETAQLPAIGSSAMLVTPTGATQTITPQGGVYTLQLPAATNQNAPWDPTLYAIGGRPYLVIERDLQAPTASLEAPRIAWQGGPTVRVSWSGDDGLGGGVADFTVKVAKDGGAWETWLVNTTQTSGDYPVAAGHNYAFAVTARDAAGNESEAVTLSIPVMQPQP